MRLDTAHIAVKNYGNSVLTEIPRKENDMNGTGIIRRVDDLGRIALPKEAMRKAEISAGTPMEIFSSTDGIVLQKYVPEADVYEMLMNLSEAVDDLSADLGEIRTGDIQGYIQEIQILLKNKKM